MSWLPGDVQAVINDSFDGVTCKDIYNNEDTYYNGSTTSFNYSGNILKAGIKVSYLQNSSKTYSVATENNFNKELIKNTFKYLNNPGKSTVTELTVEFTPVEGDLNTVGIKAYTNKETLNLDKIKRQIFDSNRTKYFFYYQNKEKGGVNFYESEKTFISRGISYGSNLEPTMIALIATCGISDLLYNNADKSDEFVKQQLKIYMSMIACNLNNVMN